MSELVTKSRPARLSGMGWKSVDQLAEMWGMDPSRARLVVGALLDSGRMERRGQTRHDPVFRPVL